MTTSHAGVTALKVRCQGRLTEPSKAEDKARLAKLSTKQCQTLYNHMEKIRVKREKREQGKQQNHELRTQRFIERQQERKCGLRHKAKGRDKTSLEEDTSDVTVLTE